MKEDSIQSISEYEVHELIVQHIAENGIEGLGEPNRVKFPANHEIPKGTYEKDSRDIWARTEEIV